MPRKQLLTLGAATITAGLTVPVAFISTALKITLPQVILTILLLIAVVLIGYGVARYSALIEGRTMRRDFYYNAIAMAQITLIYSFVTWVSVAMFDVPAAAFVFVIVLSIFTHNLVDATRRTLDSIFYRRENRQLRENLRRLAREGGLQNFEDNITLALESMCKSVRATFGLILLFDDQNLNPFASFNIKRLKVSQPIRDFITDDVLQITPDQFPEPLKKAVLLVPLYVDTNQIGVVVLGRPVNSLNYSRDDIELLLYPSDRLAEAIHTAQRETEYLQQLSQLNIPPKTQHQIPVIEVENALRNLYNYALLGDTPFSKLRLVGAKLSPDAVTHIDRGKAVYQVMVEAIEKLRPDADPPRDPPPREWHPYVILHGAYLEEKLNRDIMSQLYISEGTFNRTRRGAVRSVARILDELETKTH
ncbi:MAG: GAF domain-containing protein [Anaerolineales bacterium]|nr:GAF domain-containing protein [Anaerolineales bacterium]